MKATKARIHSGPTRQIADNLRAEMARQRVSQAQMASRLGMSQQAVSRRVSGAASMSVDELYRFCAVLGINPGTVLPAEQVSA